MRKKIGNWGGGVIQFSNYTPPNPTSPPYPIKIERSLNFLCGDNFAMYNALNFVVQRKPM